MTKEEKEEKIKHLLERGVENIYPSKEYLEKLLKQGKPISLYLGIDPTGPSLHLGHAINLHKLRQFQELGHKVILLIGSFTAMIGDPDKKETRKQLTREQVMENCELYQKQAAKILDFTGDNPAKLVYNHEWLDPLTFRDVIELASHFTVQQMLERDMFDLRIKEGRPIRLHEFLYPLMQGYDSVAMDIDGELGGNDQTFNMLAGRDLMKSMKNKEKFVLTMKLLTDTSGQKMGKTEGNMLVLDESAEEMFGKVMSWTDGMILSGFELCTLVPAAEIKKIAKDLEAEANPRDYKMKLAFEIAKLYHGQAGAKAAEEHFVNVFVKKETPEEIEEFVIGKDEEELVEILAVSGMVDSKSEARRAIKQNGVKVGGEVISDIHSKVKIPAAGVIVQKGKRHFKKIVKK